MRKVTPEEIEQIRDVYTNALTQHYNEMMLYLVVLCEQLPTGDVTCIEDFQDFGMQSFLYENKIIHDRWQAFRDIELQTKELINDKYK